MLENRLILQFKNEVQKKYEQNIRHLVFPRGPPPQY